MKRRITAAAIALCVSLGVTAVAEAATKPSEVGGVRFDQEGNRTVAIGNVRSPSAQCEARRKVILFARTTDGETVRLGIDRTSDNGGFFFNARLPQDLDETFAVAPPKRVSKRLRCASANGGINPVDTNPND